MCPTQVACLFDQLYQDTLLTTSARCKGCLSNIHSNLIESGAAGELRLRLACSERCVAGHDNAALKRGLAPFRFPLTSGREAPRMRSSREEIGDVVTDGAKRHASVKIVRSHPIEFE